MTPSISKKLNFTCKNMKELHYMQEIFKEKNHINFSVG